MSRNLFEGDYEISHRDSAGNVIGQINQTISNSDCVLVNLIPDGEFDDNVLGSEWRINGNYQFHWDGYVKDGLIIYGHTITVLDISEYITEGEEYLVKLYVKAIGEEQVGGQYVIIQDFNPRLLHGETVAEGHLDKWNSWIELELVSSFIGNRNNVLTLTSEYNGDIMIDHAQVIPLNQMCKTKILF